MNKKIIKKFLIIIGLILLVSNFIIYFIDYGDIIDALLAMSLETILDLGELESTLSILGMAFLFFGLIIKNENTQNTIKDNKNSIMKYEILRMLGYLPFVGILCFAIYSSICGFSSFFSRSYGLEAFLGTILWGSIFIWPLYIIGAIIIIKSSSKIDNFKKSNVQDITDHNKE